ncbi:short chain dehydrogenase domain-containing protein [Sarocladium implicatum]|nr:short chain dehydrogenase domain-containing protein [Sarocladium implicatum]
MSALSMLKASKDIWLSNLLVTLPYPEPVEGIEEQTIIVTGANGGLGYQACRHLLRIGVGKLIMAVRRVDQGEEAKHNLLEVTKRDPAAVEVWELDLCSYDSVKRFATKAMGTLPRLDAVLANAAVCTTSFALDEGTERSITVNVISQCFLLLLLLPKLREAPSTPRFSIVSSKVHYMAKVSQLQPRTEAEGNESTFDRLSDEKTANMADRYNLSKLLALYATRGMANALSASGKRHIVLNAPNPSYCRSGLEREEGAVIMKVKYAVMAARTPDMGSRALVHGVLAGKETHGEFLNDCHVEAPGPTVTSKEGIKAQKAFCKELFQKLEAISPGVTANI